MKLKSYAMGHWYEGQDAGQELFHAVTGEKVAEITSAGLDFKGMLDYARKTGSPKLKKMTFHERARMLKALAQYLMSKKDEFYKLSAYTGATHTDSWVDIEGGIGTLFTYATKGRRELPDEPFYIDGKPENLSKKGTFIGHHIAVPLEGPAIHINAFNFPCWGMLEKLSPTLLAGVPAIIKPASQTAYLTELMVREIINSGILPEGALQLVCGSLGDMLDYVDCQNVVTLTGSASTGKKLKSMPSILDNSVRFNMEADSLNFCMLCPDSEPGKPEFDLFIKEVAREMTSKAGQKCTAIRRIIVPENLVDPVIDAINLKLSKIKIGNPALDGVKMGPLVSKGQVEEVRQRVDNLLEECELVSKDFEEYEIISTNPEQGAFFPTTLLYCDDPFNKLQPHNTEAFGPVSTVIPYKNIEDAIELAKLGKGSLVGSVFTSDNETAREIVLGTAAYHGRINIINKDCAGESTGHGSPLPHMVHGGPGRAGGGEELGGIRSVFHYMQRTAIQGHPTTISAINIEWYKGAETFEHEKHPFRKYFEELQIGDTLITHKRTITEADIVNFAGVSGDNFYAHTDITSLPGSLFEKRVAHGYLVIAAAAGLFVDPKKGPVLANYGIEEATFIKPVYVNDTIWVQLTVKSKTKKETREGDIPMGIVKWDVAVYNSENEHVARAVILTMRAIK